MSETKHDTLRFGIVTDIHYNPETETGNKAEAGLERCVETWTSEGVEFVIQLGDLISREGPEAEADLIAVRDMLARFPGPVHHVAGNHCLAVPPERFKAIMGLDSLYYTFASYGIRFIVLDIGARQLKWFVNELDLALNNEEPVIILSHLPLLEESTDEKHGLLWNHEEVVEMLSRYPNVRAVLSGHYHSAAQVVRNGTQFLVLPAFRDCDDVTDECCFIAEFSDNRLAIHRVSGGTLLNDSLA